jgi:hypothetical protein
MMNSLRANFSPLGIGKIVEKSLVEEQMSSQAYVENG